VWQSIMRWNFSIGGMNGKDILLRRLRNQGVVGGGAASGKSAGEAGLPEALVATMGCIQAQDFAQAKWAIGVRVPEVSEADVDAAFNEGRILRTHVLRPTWHFVLPSDIRWMLLLSAPRIRQLSRQYHGRLGIDAVVLRKSRKILAKALEGGKALTRGEIAALYRRAKIDTDDIRMGFLLMDAELEGLVCSGPRKGKQFTYVLLEERASRASVLSPEEAVGELAVRYFSSRGPATVVDFAWWSGLTVGQAKEGLEAVRGELERVVVDGQEYWFSEAPRDDSAGSAREMPSVLLLPGFDEYTVAYRDRSLMVADEHVKVSSHGLKPAVVVNGRVAGVWRRVLQKDRVVVEATVFEEVSGKVWDAVKKEARRYADFAGGKLEFRGKVPRPRG
jgi:hypothetical protein